MGRCSKVGPWWRRSCNHDGGVPVSDNKAEENGVASELKELTTEPIEAVVRPEMARAELAMGAQRVRWRMAVAWLRQGRLGGGSDSTKVHMVISRWRRS